MSATSRLFQAVDSGGLRRSALPSSATMRLVWMSLKAKTAGRGERRPAARRGASAGGRQKHRSRADEIYFGIACE